jgi:hypothetical protein
MCVAAAQDGRLNLFEVKPAVSYRIICGWLQGVRALRASSPASFAATLLLKSAPKGNITGTHEDLHHLPANLLR